MSAIAKVAPLPQESKEEAKVSDQFVCIDCETTGPDPATSHIVEIAAQRFAFTPSREIAMGESYETLIDPESPISAAATKIHHISKEMIQGKPKVREILPIFLKFIEGHIIVGHNVYFDIDCIAQSALRHQIPCQIRSVVAINTARIAWLDRISLDSTLGGLCRHFQIEQQREHRAMDDVVATIKVFKYLAAPYKTSEELLEKTKPVVLTHIPIGKYSGQPFSGNCSDSPSISRSRLPSLRSSS